MLKLLTHEPRWIDLGLGVRVKVTPPNGAIRLAVMMDIGKEATKKAEPSNEEAGLALAVAEAKAYAKRVVTAWEGVADENGKPVEKPTPELVEKMLDQHPAGLLVFINEYIAPLRQLDEEKNASAPSPNGNTAEAQDTAKPARKSAKSARGGKTSR